MGPMQQRKESRLQDGVNLEKHIHFIFQVEFESTLLLSQGAAEHTVPLSQDYTVSSLPNSHPLVTPELKVTCQSS